MKRIFSVVSVINLALLIFLGVLFSTHLSDGKLEKVGYIDNVKLFNGFKMAQELNATNQQKLKAQASVVDSLYKDFQELLQEKKKDEKQLQSLQQQLQGEDQKLKELSEFISKDLSQQVWNRLNVYIKEFGKQKELKLLIGTQGNGNIMYGEEALDYTDQLLAYSNLKYEGN